jgi:hypothetical protein
MSTPTTYSNSVQIDDIGDFDTYIQSQNLSGYMYSVYDTQAGVVTLFFSAPLSNSDQTKLTQACSAYVAPDSSVPYYYKCSGMDGQSTNNTTWTTLMTSAYQGQLIYELGVLSYIKARGYLSPNLLDDSGSSNFYYDLRLVDDSNNVYAQGRFTNKNVQDLKLTVTNPPVNPCIMRFQAKKGPAGSVVNILSYCGLYECS